MNVSQLRREIQKLEQLLPDSGQQTMQEAFAAKDNRALLLRIVEQVPLVLDELEWELSLFRAEKKFKEAEKEKNKHVLYFLAATLIIGFCTVLVIAPFVVGASFLERIGVNFYISFTILIVLIIAIVTIFKALRRKK